MKPRAHLTLSMHLGPFAFGGAPEPGWTFRTGGSADPGCFLTETDPEGRLWLTRFWTASDSSEEDRWGVMLGVRVHVPEAAAESFWAILRARRS